MTGRILEITFVLIALFLVLQDPGGFSSIIGAISRAYVGAVKTLQGR